jgi:PhzF family phenazine biosynthesis protein
MGSGVRNYKVVDVFTEQPLSGNPVAVVLDAEGLDTDAMQHIARWTNLSETTFLLPPNASSADYRLRIFTPLSELPFAGHPTLGSAHAILESGLVTPRDGRLVQECGVGLVEVCVSGDGIDRRYAFGLPPAAVRPLHAEDVDELEAVLGESVVRAVAPAIIDVGPIWVVAQVSNVATLLSLEPDFARSAAFERRVGATGISVFAEHEADAASIEVRSFAPSCGVDEDPVCGSGNGCVAVFRRERELLGPAQAGYTATQGQRVGRDGRVTVEFDATGQPTVSGACVTSVEGVLRC